MRLKFNTKKKISFFLIASMMFTMFSFKPIKAQAQQGTVNINDYYTYPNETAYVVTDTDGLNTLSAIVIQGITFSGVTITQENDITFDPNTQSNFIPIGFYDAYPFEGTYDGSNYTISGINYSFNGYTGLFGYINGATVKNVGIINSTIIGGTATGSIVGIATNNSTITACYCTSSSLDSTSFVGGIAGELSNSTISECFNSSSNTFAANIAGGIVGKNDGTVTRCYNSGNLNGSSTTTSIGGIVGDNDSTLNNCYNSGSVGGGTSNTGGIAGTLITASPPDAPSFTNVYNSGFISDSGTGNVGGLVGSIQNDGQFNPTITNAYYLNTSARTAIGSNTTGVNFDTTSLTSDQMNNNAFAYNLNTTNGTATNSGIWTRVSTINNGYPIFAGPTSEFSPIYQLTIVPGANGTISYDGVSNGVVYVQGGTSIALNVTPNTGYTLTNLILNGTSEANTTGVFTMPSEDSTVQPVFSLENYSITADLNGGTLGTGVTIPSSYTIQSPDIILPTASQISRPGYTFGGWINSNDEVITSIPTGSTGNVSITAVWQAIEYTITTYLNGGTLGTGVTIPETYNVGQLPITLPDSSQITRSGYTFDGWYTSSDFSGSPITEIAAGTIGDISIYAKWSLTQYTITVELDGGTLASGVTIPATYNILDPPIVLPTPPEITREGYTFTGWRLGPDSTSEVISEIPQGSTGNITIYAGWSINDYALTAYLNGGTLNTGVTIPSSFTINSLPIILPTAAQITRAGYTFEGWYENADFSGSAITEIPAGTLENVSIYANWTPITYTIITELNGGTLTGTIPDSYTVLDLPITLPSASEISREGYTFEGWYTTADFSGNAITEIAAGTTGDITLYAKWNINEYSLTAYLNGGTLNTGVTIPSSFTINSLPIVLPTADQITRAGYTFDGWYENSDFSGSTITEIPAGTLENVSIYAKWSVITYTITTELNGGTLSSGTTIPETYTVEDLPIVLPTSEEVTRTGYSFGGWYTASDFSGDAITEIAAGTTGNLTLYAAWDIIEYTLSAYLNGGTLNTGVTIPSGFTIDTLPVILPNSSQITRAGYTFDGWYENADFSGNPITEIPAGTLENVSIYADWTPITYTITTELNGGTLGSGISIPDSYTVEELPIVLPTSEEITRAGYTFGGWYTTSDFSGNAITEIAAGTTGDLTLYAKWDIIEYTLSTYLNGGTLNTGVTIPTGFTVETLPIVLPSSAEITRPGYSFDGWYENADFSGSAITEIPAGTLENVSIYAKWDPITYTITTELNGGTLSVDVPASYTVENLPIVLPSSQEVTRTGYTFEGWYTASDFSGNAITEIPAGTTGDITIYAKWELTSYTITTVLNGGTLISGAAIPASYTVESLPIVLPTDSEVTRTGYTFDGWYTTSDFSGSAITEIPVGTTGNVTIYAKWDPVTYTITTVLNGGTLEAGSIPASYTVADLPIVLPTASQVTRDGFTFDGWYTTSDFSGNQLREIPAGTTGDITLYAKWSANIYTITTVLNGGTLSPGVTIPSTYTVLTEPVILPTAAQITRAGYTFGGWYETADFSGEPITQIGTETTGDITIYAQWIPINYTITTQLNGGTLNSGVTIPGEYNADNLPITLPTAAQVTRAGYSFSGWYTTPDFSGTAITEIPVGTTGNITIYAAWTANVYTITADLNGGVLNQGVSIPAKYTVSQLPIVLPTAEQITRTGYSFGGWYYTADFSGSAITEIAPRTTGNVTIYAQWIPVTYTITTELNGGTLGAGISIPSEYNVEDLPITLPSSSEVTRLGYTFGGWYRNADFSGSAITEIPAGTTGDLTIYAAWTANTYNIIADLNGGVLNQGVSIPSTYTVAALPIVLPTAEQITRTGYSFGGWYENADFSGSAITEIAPETTGNVTVYAQWIPVTYTITTELNGGVLASGVSIPQEYNIEDLPITLPTSEQITRSGYSFGGWYYTADFSGSAVTEIAAGTTGDLTLYAKWTANTYTITADLNGGVLNQGVSIPLTYNVSQLPIVLPTAAQITRSGYSFGGWYYTADFSGSAITEIAPGTTGDVTVYAQWIPVIYTITTELNGGSLNTGVIIPSEYNVEELPITLPTAEQVTRTGYDFSGWYYTADFSGSAVTEIAAGTTGDLTLYAKWTPAKYSITAYLNGGTLNEGIVIPSIYTSENLPIILPTESQISRPGYTFGGWYESADFSGSAITEIPVGTLGNVTIYAKWNPIDYSIDVELNGGQLASGVVIPDSYNDSELPISLPDASQVTRSGYTFSGWYYTADFTGSAITEISAGTIGNITIYARWTPINYPLNTYLNGGTLQSGITLPASYNASQLPLILPTAAEVTRAGYTFDGWYFSADFSGSAVTEIPSGTTGEVSIYAKWIENRYTITAYLNGGSLNEGVVIPPYYEITSLPIVLPTASEVTREGYIFRGWYENADFSGNEVTEIPTGTTGDIVLYAKWQPIQYSISSYLNGGTLNQGVIIPESYDASSLPIVLPNETQIARRGYTFGGWYFTADFSGSAITEIPAGTVGDVSIYARWIPNVYIINTFLDGGTLTEGITIPNSYTVPDLPINLPASSEVQREGYDFGGWYTNSSFTGNPITQIAAGTIGDINIYARWIPIEYTITSDLNGGTLNAGVTIPQTYNVTQLPIILPSYTEITRPGFAFAGWYETPFFEGTPLTEIPAGTTGNINLYADWSEKQFSLVSYLNGGTLNEGVTIPTSFNEEDLPIILPTAEEITRPGFAFGGWYTNSSFTGDPITEIPVGTDQNTSIYAKWTDKEYSIISYLNGGTLAEGVTIPGGYNVSELPIELPNSSEISRRGYTFDGWYTNSDFEGSSITSIPVGTTGNVSIYAKWTENEYSITSYLNGGTLKDGVTIPLTYTISDLPISLPAASDITRSGYTFAGWYTNSDFTGNPITEITEADLGNISLYAKWVADEYTITTYLNGGTLNEGITIPETYNVTQLPIRLPAGNEVSRAGYVFAGWYTNSNFEGSPITEIAPGTTGNISLYAAWIAVSEGKSDNTEYKEYNTSVFTGDGFNLILFMSALLALIYCIYSILKKDKFRNNK